MFLNGSNINAHLKFKIVVHSVPTKKNYTDIEKMHENTKVNLYIVKPKKKKTIHIRQICWERPVWKHLPS